MLEERLVVAVLFSRVLEERVSVVASLLFEVVERVSTDERVGVVVRVPEELRVVEPSELRVVDSSVRVPRGVVGAVLRVVVPLAVRVDVP